jgi:hypothetical protein
MDTATLTYSNPRMEAVIADWPLGGSRRGTATFKIEVNAKGERGTRTTVDPRNGRISAPKLLTYASKMRIVDGSDGRTYIAAYSPNYGHISVFQSNMQFQQESIHDRDPRFAEVKALFDMEAA